MVATALVVFRSERTVMLPPAEPDPAVVTVTLVPVFRRW